VAYALRDVYQLRNLESREQLRVRRVRRWRPAEDRLGARPLSARQLDERETYDLFGIVSTTTRPHPHPDADDWSGIPLRRDYPVGGETVEFSEEHEKWQTAPDEA